MTLLPHAVRAVQRGFAVFPAAPREKTPHLLFPDKPWPIRWSEVATRDLGTVARMWAWSPWANVGVAAAPSGLLVVDLDGPKADWLLRGGPYDSLHDRFGPRPHGDDVLREMCGRYGGDWAALMATYRVCTGSLGAHLYFRWPHGLQASQGSPVPGFVDIRCNGGQRGGYVLGAGSVTVKGPYVVENDGPVLDAPAWLVELCREKPRIQQPRPQGLQQPRGAGYFGGLVDQVRGAPEGSRHDTLVWAACRMSDDGAPLGQAEQLLVPAACAGGLPETEARGTIGRAYRTARGS